jgi:hypothetical protein
MRSALIAAGGLDQRTEPVPLVGRADSTDLLNVGLYLVELLRRAAGRAGCELEELSVRALAVLEALRLEERPSYAG